MEEKENNYWMKQWEINEKKLAKARFVTGWLIACLEEAGLTSVQASEKLAMAEKEADRIYG